MLVHCFDQIGNRLPVDIDPPDDIDENSLLGRETTFESSQVLRQTGKQHRFALHPAHRPAPQSRRDQATKERLTIFPDVGNTQYMTTRRRGKGGRPQLVAVIASPADLETAIAMKEPPDLFELRLDSLSRIARRVEKKIPCLRAPMI